MAPVRTALLLVGTAASFCLASCGGGGGSSGTTGNTGTAGNVSTYTAGVYKPESTFAESCAAPRSGTSDKQGTTTDENNWLRSWTNDLYLWYSEVPDVSPASYTATADYFALLKTSATTASGAAKDKFHFTYATDYWQALSNSGQSPGYGFQVTLISSKPPREVVVAYNEPNSPATTGTANLARGAHIVSVDDVAVLDSSDVATLNAGLFPKTAGETHKFGIVDLGGSTASPRTVTLTSATITSRPVQNVHTINMANGHVVGYMLFNDHLATSESELVSAFTTLRDAAVDDLVLDIRYNGGGYLDIASEVAYMIAGNATTGKNFETAQFNSKHPTVDPVSGKTITPVDFHSTSEGFTSALPAGAPLPTLNLPRVFVLTSEDTCSASESIINSLRGIDIEVIQIGHQTCGKPYGFYPQDNCGTTYFSIQFRGINNKNYGDYTDGFSPGVETPSDPSIVEGCKVSDDYTHALGDVNEARLAAALQYRANPGSCPAVSIAPGTAELAKAKVATSSLGAVDGVTPKSLWQENRIMRH